ncbi:MAG: DUF1566 domain-containing protein [Syntrophales bacterium]
MSYIKWLSVSIRLMILGFIFLFGIVTIIGSGPSAKQQHYSDSTPSASKTKTYLADYQISLKKVERPEKAGNRYGLQKVDIVKDDAKYKFSFEDDMVRILWFVDSKKISFMLQNKTNYSIKIPWDEAAFVDELGRSHRVMHSGAKYNDRDKPQPPSIIVRKGSFEDIVFPTDYVTWSPGSRYTTGEWVEKPFFLDQDYHGLYTKGQYSSPDDFEKAVSMNVGKQIQVLLPLQIQDVINDYIFTFVVEKVNVPMSSLNKKRVAANEIAKDGRFIAYDNGTVIDTNSGLMWAAKDNGADITWQDAESYCQNYSGGDYSDWRMPTSDELLSIYDASKPKKVDCSIFPFSNYVATNLIDISCVALWTSNNEGSKASHVFFRKGNTAWGPKSNKVYTRALPVRSAK